MCQNLYALPVCTEKGRYLKEKNFMDDRERLNIVIMQMVEHNKVHVENYAKWARFAKKTSWMVQAPFWMKWKNLPHM